MDSLMFLGLALAIALLGFGAGFLVAAHNAKNAASILAAVNAAKDAVNAHATATAVLAAVPTTTAAKPATPGATS